LHTENEFSYWKKIHDTNSLDEFNKNTIGQLWLKLKSIVRPELIKEFVGENNINLLSSTSAKQFEEIFALLNQNVVESHKILDRYIVRKNKSVLTGLNADSLVSELYKLQTFECGGDNKIPRNKLRGIFYSSQIFEQFELILIMDFLVPASIPALILDIFRYCPLVTMFADRTYHSIHPSKIPPPIR